MEEGGNKCGVARREKEGMGKEQCCEGYGWGGGGGSG